MKKLFALWMCIILTIPAFVIIDVDNNIEGKDIVKDSTMYIVSEPFRINSNADFATYANGGGNGSKENPWVIENLEINGTGYGYCLFIGNTTDFFKVNDCYFHHAGSFDGYPFYYDSGISLFNVRNGIITRNLVSDNYCGIFLYSSCDNSILRNTASNNIYGFIFNFGSHRNILLNNVASSSYYGGMHFSEANGNTISENTVSNVSMYPDGMSFYSSVGNRMYDNVMLNCGILLDGYELEHWNSHVITSTNTVNGKPIYYISNQTSGTVPENAGQIILANCSGISVVNQNISNGFGGIQVGFSRGNIISNNTIRASSKGISLFFSDENDIVNNTVTQNKGNGISISYSNGINVSNNFVEHNYRGIYLFLANNLTLNKNYALNNEWGIYIDSSNNITIVGNNASQNNYSGITVSTSRNHTIVNNAVSLNNYAGITGRYSEDFNIFNNEIISNWYGINLVDSQTSVVSGNNVSSNIYGIVLSESHNNSLFGNIIEKGEVGVLIQDCSCNNSIGNNTIMNNKFFGIEFHHYSINNAVFHNNFVHNAQQAINSLTNYWDNGYPTGGNYWSNYKGSDSFSGPDQNEPGSDGIGDTPHVINAYSRDNYPLMVPIDPISPMANAGINQTVDEGTIVHFNGSASTDNIGIANYTWTFNVGGVNWSLQGVFPTHNFTVPGLHPVTLNVTDLSSNWDEDVVAITVLDITPPVANAGQNRSIDEGCIAEFNGSASMDNVGIVNYSWNFVDNNENVTLFGVVAFHTFFVPGDYHVILNVTDAAGYWDTDTIVVSVRDVTPPVARAGIGLNITPGTLVTFDGSGSTDNVGITNHTWTFTHNGTAVTLYGVSPTFRFWTAGNYTVTLTVRDAAGNTDTDTVLIIVNPVAGPGDGGGSLGNYLWIIILLIVISVVTLLMVLRRKPESAEVAPEPQALQTEPCPNCGFDIEKGAPCPFCAPEPAQEPIPEPEPPKSGLSNEDKLARIEKAYKEGKMNEEQYLRNKNPLRG